MNKSWYELVYVTLHIYPAGSFARIGDLEGTLHVDKSWDIDDDYTEEYDYKTATDDTHVKFIKEYACLNLMPMDEGFGASSYLSYEFLQMGRDAFVDEDLAMVAQQGKMLRDMWAAEDKARNMDHAVDTEPSHVSFLTLWNIGVDTNGGYYGDDSDVDIDVAFDRIVRLQDATSAIILRVKP